MAGLVDERLHLARHGADSGEKALTVIGPMPDGGDSIDDVAVLRAGARSSLFDDTLAPSTVASWLRAYQWSNVLQALVTTSEAESATLSFDAQREEEE